MNDYISRQAAIDALNKLDVSDGVGISVIACDLQVEAIRSMENLPSAQPERKTGEWIPCSERLPKKGRYLVTGKKNRDWYTSDKIVTSAFYDGEFWTDNGDIQAEAWMLLPEPYKGEKP